MFLHIHSRMNRFLIENSGGVTVDWIVLTAAVCGMGLVGVTLIFSGPNNVAETTNTVLAASIITAQAIGN